MPKSIKVNISDEEYQQILEKAKEEVRYELTQEAVKKYIKEEPFLSLYGLLKEYDIYGRYRKLLEDMKSGVRYDRPFEFSSHEALLISVYHLMYNKW